MKISYSIFAVCGLALCAPVRGQSPAPSSSPAAAPADSAAPAETGTSQGTEDFSQFKTADDLWAEIQKLEEGPSDPSASPEIVMALLVRLTAAAEEFQKDYPKDVRRWEAKLVVLRFGSMIKSANGEQVDPAEIEKTLNEVAAAPDAPEDARIEARLNLISIHGAGQVTVSPDVDKEILAFIHDFPADSDDGQLQKMRLESLKTTDADAAAKLLDTLLKDPNPAVALMAKGEVAMQELMKKPLDLQFTAMDGTKVDVSKMRGKVVLVDFWATWCAPCMEEVPDVVKVYNDLHDKGLEIVGISLDQDKTLVQAVTKAQGMAWPQYFDGKMWDNAVSSRFGISSIPEMWLVDKKGMVVDTSPADDLENKVTKLLAQ